MCYYVTVNLYNVDGFASRRSKKNKVCLNWGRAIAEMEKQSLSFGPVSFQSPAVVEVVRFPSGSKTLDNDTVGEHEQHLNPFTVLIYINPVFDVNASPVVLIFNIVGTHENCKAM